MPLWRAGAGAGAGADLLPPNEPNERPLDEEFRLLLAGDDFPEENPLLNELDFDGRESATTSVTAGSRSASSSAILNDFIIFLEPL
jgi:hypothetical protein